MLLRMSGRYTQQTSRTLFACLLSALLTGACSGGGGSDREERNNRNDAPETIKPEEEIARETTNVSPEEQSRLSALSQWSRQPESAKEQAQEQEQESAQRRTQEDNRENAAPPVSEQSREEMMAAMDALIERTDAMLLNAPPALSVVRQASPEQSATPLAQMLDVQRQRFNELYGRFNEAGDALGE